MEWIFKFQVIVVMLPTVLLGIFDHWITSTLIIGYLAPLYQENVVPVNSATLWKVIRTFQIQIKQPLKHQLWSFLCDAARSSEWFSQKKLHYITLIGSKICLGFLSFHCNCPRISSVFEIVFFLFNYFQKRNWKLATVKWPFCQNVDWL